MMTDGGSDIENVSDIYRTIREGNERMENTVVIFTYGIGPGMTMKTLLSVFTKQIVYAKLKLKLLLQLSSRLH